jgi:hypothetical protein
MKGRESVVVGSEYLSESETESPFLGRQQQLGWQQQDILSTAFIVPDQGIKLTPA